MCNNPVSNSFFLKKMDKNNPIGGSIFLGQFSSDLLEI